ncbi:NAD(P)H-dependent oxidoreductase, partial [Aggregatibacter actinomycetemcomitans]
MKHLIISAHPNQQSFNRAIVERIVKASHELGAEITVRDLYTLNFNPVLSWNELSAGPE